MSSQSVLRLKKRKFIHLAISDNHLPNGFGNQMACKIIYIEFLQGKSKLGSNAIPFEVSKNQIYPFGNLRHPTAKQFKKVALRECTHLQCNLSHFTFLSSSRRYFRSVSPIWQIQIFIWQMLSIEIKASKMYISSVMQ